ncbi:hypothetical protein [Salininema proteolyticum]|uniref:Diadenosine tetraphosphate (Ap4A) hydrolase n=1 Tax=Salininema proteolyticum TaxID=1607685 RepID=A0ABV8TYC5_9ACTN
MNPEKNRFTRHLVGAGENTVPLAGLAIPEVFTAEEVTSPAVELLYPEPERHGAGGVECGICSDPDEKFVWANDRWRISTADSPRSVFFVNLVPREHYVNMSDLPTPMAEEQGRLLALMERALLAMEGAGRVHTHYWGDGAEHHHMWQIVRPEGFVQGRGVSLAVWLKLLPAMDAEDWESVKGDFAKALDSAAKT